MNQTSHCPIEPRRRRFPPTSGSAPCRSRLRTTGSGRSRSSSATSPCSGVVLVGRDARSRWCSASRCSSSACSASPRGYHRYFAHRTYKTSRVVPVRARAASRRRARRRARCGGRRITATTTSYSRPADGDVHSPRAARLLVLARRLDLRPTPRTTDCDQIRDFAQLPRAALPRTATTCCRRSLLGVVVWLCDGLARALHRLLPQHGAAAGTARSRSTRSRTCWASGATRPTDDSRNNWLLALLTLGEGWHNNHHHYQASARQGFYWWEIDITYYVLQALARLGLVWDLREPPLRVLAAGRESDRQARRMRFEPHRPVLGEPAVLPLESR